MAPSFSRASNARDASPRQRLATLLLVLGIHALLVLLLSRLAPPSGPPAGGSAPILVTLLPEAQKAATRSRVARKAARRAESSRRPPPPPPPHAVSPATSAIWSQVVPLDREALAAGDIAKLPTRARQPATGEGMAVADGGSSGAAAGGGPDGQQLFDADWYRRPTDAELSTYIPAGAPREGWGMIACRTVAGYRVEDCREIGQSPPGSGLARAVREASWQFRVLPPRINGRPLIGAWVRIRIDYTERKD